MPRELAPALVSIALASCAAAPAALDALDASPPADPTAVCDALAEAACDAWARCECGDALGWWDRPACVSIVRVECAGAIATTEVSDAVARGELRFDAAAARALLEAASGAGSAECAPLVLELEPMLVGTRAPSESCARLSDVVDTCAEGLTCAAGLCAARALGIDGGAPCPCVAGLECDASATPGGLCRAQGTPGALTPGSACTAPSDCESLLCIERCTPAACRWTLRGDGDAWLVLPGP